MRYIKNQIFLFTLCFVSFGIAQERKQINDTLDTQTINVVKPYVPTVSDAFRINKLPEINGSDYESQQTIDYHIFSVPVASTFSPDKGTPQKIKRVRLKSPPSNYLSVAAGNYFNVQAKGFLGLEIDKTSNFHSALSHNSSAGGIKDLKLKDSYSDSNLSLGYDKSFKSGTWQTTADLSYASYNWYGIDEELWSITPNDLEVSHAYFGMGILSEYIFKNGNLKKINGLFKVYGDSHDSSETRLKTNAELQFTISDQILDLGLDLDFLKGEFISGFKNEFNNLLVGLNPSYFYETDFFQIRAGLKLNYLSEADEKVKFLIAPNVKFTYELVEGYLTSYAEVTGGVSLNSYENTSNVNPYVAPNLILTPTSTPYDATLGLRGLFTESIGFGLSTSYMSQKNKLFFTANGVSKGLNAVYDYGNSFGLIYDDLKTWSIGGDVSFQIGANFNLNLKGDYSIFNTDSLNDALNLSPINLSMISNFKINDSWAFGASLFYTGVRKDNYQGLTGPKIIELDPFVDLNLEIDYQYNSNWNFFINGLNLVAGSYQKWHNYPVQGLQILAGAKYHFDF